MQECSDPPTRGDQDGLEEIEVGALPFARAVVRQLGHGGRDGQESSAALTGVLAAAREGREEEAAEALAADHRLLAAFFQNADLLYDHGYAAADAVSAVVLHALHLAVEREPEKDVLREPKG